MDVHEMRARVAAEARVDSPTTYLQVGFVLISLANLAVLAAMLVLFVLALILPFVGHATPTEKPRR